MNANIQTSQKTGRPSPVQQMRVRCDVRAGDDLATCQWNVNKWRDRYQQAYNQARQRGCI